MNFHLISVVATFVAGALQLGAACYALRLNRLFGAARVGWSLFSAFSLLALIQWVPNLASLPPVVETAGGVDLLYAVVSLLIFISMVHIEAVIQERKKLQDQERRLRAELEEEVKKKTGYLQRAIEGLQAEIDERRRVEEENLCLRILSPAMPGATTSRNSQTQTNCLPAFERRPPDAGKQ